MRILSPVRPVLRTGTRALKPVLSIHPQFTPSCTYSLQAKSIQTTFPSAWSSKRLPRFNLQVLGIPRNFHTAVLKKIEQTRKYSKVAEMVYTDPNTLSNYGEIRTVKTEFSLDVDFEKSHVTGWVQLSMRAEKNDVKEIVLDTSYLDISKVEVNNEEIKSWIVEERVKIYGSPLRIKLPKAAQEGEIVEVKVHYSTTEKCTALQWMDRMQTSNKKHPYMFSQCQAIHARSLYPSQDTPAVKSPFRITIGSDLPVVATGRPVGIEESSKPGSLRYSFEQPIPIPSYLFAIATGDLASARIGTRSLVYTGPEELVKCKAEMEDDMDGFLNAAESLVSKYQWLTYNVLILPPSFPYGGMENPNITFATPTIISGDKSNIDVIAHELAHSWSGNSVSNASWEHFWLNEGWTVYLERRIQALVKEDDREFDFSAIIGWKALKESVELFGHDHEFTKLVQNLKGQDPDESFSSVPYEKGFNFLYHLDKTVTRAKWDKFIPHYFETYKQKSLTTDDFKSTLLSFFASDASASAALATVDWNTWLYAPGMPEQPDFDTSLVNVSYALADQWKALNSSTSSFVPKASDIEGWTSGQIVVFLERITDFETPLRKGLVETMRNEYGFESSGNAEILSRYLTVGLKARWEGVFEPTAEALGGWGRMKFVRPLYRLLNECDRQLAVDTFEKNRSFYHPICRDNVARDLGLSVGPKP
ncbi:Leucyl aminopeptidase yscIV [Rhizina undulata]